MRTDLVRLKLPATSANLGPGFDSVALALRMHLEVEARPAREFSIDAVGFSADVCSRLEGNLLLTTYEETGRAHGLSLPPLELRMRNGIPLGMGCGSSAATRLAGVALASSFGRLGWSREQILAEAVRLEGHPDNAAACWLGGFVAAATCGGSVHAISVPPPAWHALLVLPPAPLPTQASRGLLPERYGRAEVVHNLQRVALLTAAFSSARADLLACATTDLLHQPFRAEACPLFTALEPAVGHAGILSVTLSGAGPGVLLLLESETSVPGATEWVAVATREHKVERLLGCPLEPEAATHTIG